VNVRIRHKTTNDKPCNGVGEQHGHENPFFRGASLYEMFFLRKRKTVYLMVSLYELLDRQGLNDRVKQHMQLKYQSGAEGNDNGYMEQMHLEHLILL
jgi:hypothetical protein